MKIRYRSYIIKSCDVSPDRFDLQKVVKSQSIGTGTRNNPNGQEYESFADLGYAMSLSTCFGYILSLETNSSFKKEEEIELNTYLQRFTEQREMLKSYITSETQIKIN